MTETDEYNMTSKPTTKGKRCTLDIPGLGLVDGRTSVARHYGQAVDDLAADLGGADAVTAAERELVRRAAGLSVLATRAAAALLNGEAIDVSELVSVANAQRRLLVTLGLERRQRDVPDLHDYLRQPTNQEPTS